MLPRMRFGKRMGSSGSLRRGGPPGADELGAKALEPSLPTAGRRARRSACPDEQRRPLPSFSLEPALDPPNEWEREKDDRHEGHDVDRRAERQPFEHKR